VHGHQPRPFRDANPPAVAAWESACLPLSRFQPRFLGVWPATGGFGNVILSLNGRTVAAISAQGVYLPSALLLRGSDSLELMGVQYRPELVILNSREDAKKLRVPFSSGADLQGLQRIHYAVITTSSSTEERQAAEVIVAVLYEELRKAISPTSEARH